MVVIKFLTRKRNVWDHVGSTFFLLLSPDEHWVQVHNS